MSIKSEVRIDFDNAIIHWGISDGLPATVHTVKVRGLPITVHLHGEARAKKTAILSSLQRIKPFVQGGRIKTAIRFNSHIKLFLVHYEQGQIAQWKDHHSWEDVGDYQYGIWFNIEAQSEMLVRDADNVTSLESDLMDLPLVGFPGCIEFIKSEGGVMFIPHRLGLDSVTNQAMVAQRLRRDIWRRIRGGAHFADYGIIELRESASDSDKLELWVGENHAWDVSRTAPLDIIPDMDYFTTWGIEHVLENRTTRKRLAEFTVGQYRFI